MEPKESRSLDFKTRIKQSLAPHLLNPSTSKEQNVAPCPLNASSTEEQSVARHTIANSKCKSVGNIPFRSDPKKSERVQNSIISSIMTKSVHINEISQSFNDSFGHFPYSETQDGGLNDAKNPVETKEDTANMIAADAEELAKSFKKIKLKNNRKKKYFNLAGSNREAPNWNVSIKNVLEPNSVHEHSVKTPEEILDKGPYLLHPELTESVDTDPGTFHRLSTDDCQASENLGKVASKSTSGYRNKAHYTNEGEKVRNILRKASNFKPKKKFNLNNFDGAGVDCFKEKPKKSIKNEKPKIIPPPEGFVCVKRFTNEELRKRPVNLIVDECWDYYEDY